MTVTKAAGRRALLITARSSVRYMSGFTGTAGALWVPVDGAPVLVTDARYETQAGSELVDPIRAHIGREGWVRGVAEVVGGETGPIVFEAEGLSFADYEALRGALPAVEFISHPDLVRRPRQVKDRDEIDAIERAVAVAEAAFTRVLEIIDWSDSPSERLISAALEGELRREGSDPLPFDPIVAAGERSALPHATPSDRPLARGDLLLLDFGARVDGYCSDITRTCVRGRPEPWQVTLHEQVLEAQERARDVVGPGVACREVDAAARRSFARHARDGFFGHGTGHGIGLDVHEGPNLSTNSEDCLEPGNVVTVEPGLYLPGRGGVRIEDDVWIRDDGARTLTNLPRALVQL